MEFSTFIAVSITLILMLSGFYFLFRIELCKDYNLELEYPKVSIIIPARNEENTIGKILTSINNQKFKVEEVIVVNDSSTDTTKEIALNFNAKVIDSNQLPTDWKGKPWACWQGAHNAKGDVLFFLDADTYVEPGGLKKIIETYNYYNKLEANKNGVVLSVAPYHTVFKFYEEFSSLFNIIMVGSMNAFTPFKNNQPTGLFGQSLILSKKNYFEIGGHSSVKNKILENVFMASLFNSKGITLKCLGGKGTLSFRMYPDGFNLLINGWTKAFATGAGQTPFFSLLLIILWISSGFIISINLIIEILAGNSLLMWLSLYLGFVLQLRWMLKKIGNFKLIPTIIFPINLLFYVIVFIRSLYFQITNKSISWKSREVRN